MVASDGIRCGPGSGNAPSASDSAQSDAYADARVDKLFQGNETEVSIARTVVHDPPVLIFDDLRSAWMCHAIEMQKFNPPSFARRQTIIFSTIS